MAKEYDENDYSINSTHATDHEYEVVPHLTWLPLNPFRVKVTATKQGLVEDITYASGFDFARKNTWGIAFEPPVQFKEAYSSLKDYVRSKVIIKKDGHADGI